MPFVILDRSSETGVERFVALLSLEDHLKLNISEIDSQHEILIGLANQLLEDMQQEQAREVLDEHLSQLIDHTRAHFSYEEQLMSRHGYPGYEAHKSEHDRLMHHLDDLVDRCHRGDLLLSFAVVIELKGWATVHIAKSDKPLGAFLKSRENATSAP